MFNNTFSTMENIVVKAMSAESLRLKVISNNIANADTPRFKRSDVTFENQLKKALDSQNQQLSNKGKLTNKKHISFTQPISIDSVKPKIRMEYNTDFMNNENNVDVEAEMVNLEKTQLKYRTYADYLNRNYKLLNSVISFR